MWVASHLVQFAGIALMVAVLLLLSQQLDAAGARVWPRPATGTAAAALAVSAALQAVDGIVLKVIVDAWAAAASAQKETAVYAAFAVRQIEVGLASVVSRKVQPACGMGAEDRGPGRAVAGRCDVLPLERIAVCGGSDAAPRLIPACSAPARE